MLQVGDFVRVKDRDKIEQDGLATTDGGKCQLSFNDDGMKRFCGSMRLIKNRRDRIVRVVEDARYHYQTIYEIDDCIEYVWAEEWLVPIGGDLIVK